MGRVEYIHEEDVKIVRYIVQHNGWEYINGNKIWVLMEKANICPGRSFHSLRNRFLRSIKQRLRAEFADIVNEKEIPRKFRRELDEAGGNLRERLDERNTESVPRIENVTSEAPDPPRPLNTSPVIEEKKMKQTVEPVITDSHNVDGWTLPHFSKTTISGPKRKQLFADSQDIFLEEEAGKSTKQPVCFFTQEIEKDIMTQITIPSQPETSNSQNQVPIKTKKKPKIVRHSLFERKITSMSHKFIKLQRIRYFEQRKHERLIKWLKQILESKNENVADIIPNLTETSNRNLLANMLQSFDHEKQQQMLKELNEYL